MPHKRDSGPDLVSELANRLKGEGIVFQALDRNRARINGRLCRLAHSNSSSKKDFSNYFWGISANNCEFLILIGGRNIGISLLSRILSQMSVSKEDREFLRQPRLEHVFIIPYDHFGAYTKGLLPADNGAWNINVYFAGDLKCSFTGNGTPCQLSGQDVKRNHLIRFDQLGIDPATATRLRGHLKATEDSFPRYHNIVNH